MDKTNIQDNKEYRVEFIEFTEEDGKWFADLAVKVEWDYYENTFPEMMAIVKPMLTKK